MLTADQGRMLVEAFEAADYTVDSVLAAITDAGQRALGRNQTLPAVRALAGRRDPLATLIMVWPLQQPVRVEDLEAALPGLLAPLVRAGIARIDHDRVAAAVDIRPYASDQQSYWVCSDLTPGLDGVLAPTRPDLVLGVSQASTSLAQLTPRTSVVRALDLGTGCGVQSLHLAEHADRIVATDLNPRALELAELTFMINSVRVDLRLGDLYAPVTDERFDLITTNPPYVMSPPTSGPRLAYRDGGLSGDDLVARIVRAGADHLNDGGTLAVLGNWAHLRDRPWPERVADWVPPGCDAHVVQREELDPYEYVELWLADAGLSHSPDHRRRYGEWLDYFSRLGIEAVGLGWLLVYRTGTESPSVRVEEWPYAVEQPIASALAAERAGVELERRLTDDELLVARWVVATDVVQETVGAPGAADPQHVVLRQQRGFRRGVEVDTALAGVVGACDGELDLGLIVATVAELLQVAPVGLAADLVPRLRRLVVEGFLVPAG